MGLGIEVGMLADLLESDEEGADWLRESLSNLNALLMKHGLSCHLEPEILPPFDNRSVISSFPYSFLHQLRRAYVQWRKYPDIPITACDSDEDAASDPAIDEESLQMDSHLLCHSDCEGFYVPVPFREVLVDDEDPGRISGGMLGSSYQLAHELVEMASAIGIRLVNGELTDIEAEKIRESIETESPLWIERGVWLCCSKQPA